MPPDGTHLRETRKHVSYTQHTQLSPSNAHVTVLHPTHAACTHHYRHNCSELHEELVLTFPH